MPSRACTIACELIRDGHDPAPLVTWARGGVPIFTRDQALACGALQRLSEGAR